MENGQAFASSCQPEVLGFQTALALHTASITEHISRYRPDSLYTPSKQAKKTHGNTAGYKGYQVFGYSEAFSFDHKFINASEHIGRTNNYG